jgi:hypothetical protein
LTSLTAREKEIRRRLRDDFPHYAGKCLKIRSKSGAIEPLELNQAQLYLHAKLEEQREATGRVRALVLKGRQQGISTYLGGRYYWRSTHRKGLRVFILTHEQDATNNLFGMVDRYHTHCPALVKPSTGASNAKELLFDKLESGYAVGTAGAKAVGRSQTVQLFHGSEVAFWPNAPTHFAGVVQAIPDLPGTEIVLESTANGVGGEFHERWQQAEAGIGDYQAIFIPWYWQSEYQRPVPAGFTCDEEEQKYRDAYELTLEQMVWRRAKIAELKDPLLFKQEYPATAAEAFQTTGHDSFIKPDVVLKARKNIIHLHEAFGPLVVGVDPKREGTDRFAIAWRRGRKLIKVWSDPAPIDTLRAAGMIKDIIDRDRPAMVFIDAGGGGGIYDVLVSWGYGARMRLVNFGSAPIAPRKLDANKRPMAGPKNRRAEMWGNSRDWLEDEGGADIPDSDGLQADACGPGYHRDTNQSLLLESKEDMKKRGIRSPDEWDAVALTFAAPVLDAYDHEEDFTHGRDRNSHSGY